MIYLLHGEEKYDLYKFIDDIKKKFNNLELGVNYFVITKENINELDNLYNLISFFGNKLVVIKDTNLKFDVKKLIENTSNEDVYIIVEDKIDKRSSGYKLLNKNKCVKEFKYLNEKEMMKYMKSILSKCDLKIDDKTLEYFSVVSLEDKINNINEINKIVHYLEKGENVTKEVIDKVCSKNVHAKLFDMIECATNKNSKEAIKMLNELIIMKEPIPKITILLYKQIKQMYMIKYMKSKNIDSVNSILKLHPFVFNKLNKSSNKYSLEELRNLLNEIYEYDFKSKTGEIDFEIGLKQIICLM